MIKSTIVYSDIQAVNKTLLFSIWIINLKTCEKISSGIDAENGAHLQQPCHTQSFSETKLDRGLGCRN